jgi:pyruvate dehydrogenase E2 component (dihydrolipoamide acetyltransferase)
MTDIDVTSLEDWRTKQASKPTSTEVLIPIVAQALKENPRLNSVFEKDTIKEIQNINVGVAVDAPDGLRVPVLKNSDKMSLDEIVTTLRMLKNKAVEGTLSPDDSTGGTFTITNLGMFGVRDFTPIINPPQCAILGVGRIEETPKVRNGTIVVRKMMTLSLSFDHRAMDGVTAAKFLVSLTEKSSAPQN